MSKLLKYLNLSIFLTPLIVVSSSFIFPFIVPKILYFRSLVVLLLALFLVLIINKKITWQWNLIDYLVMFWWLSLLMSTIFSVDIYRSFWDNHERMLGFFTLSHYVVYYFIISRVFKEWLDWRLMSRVFLSVVWLIMFIGLLQKTLFPNLLLNFSNPRVSATLGNAIYFSGLGLFGLFLSLVLLKLEKVKYTWWWYLEVVAGSFSFLGIFLGGTRGTILGLLVFLIILWIGYLLKGQNKKIKISSFLIVLLLGLSIFLAKDTNFVRNLPGIGRLVKTRIHLADRTNTRIMAWQIAVESSFEHLFFGWGLNNYLYAFNKYYYPEFLLKGYGETWFDNAHSSVFNTLCTQGLFGLLAYLSLYVFLIVYLLKLVFKQQLDWQIGFLLIAFLGAHFTHNFFVFENPSSYLYFFFSLGLSSYFINNKQQKILDNNNFKLKLDILTIIIFLLAIVNIYIFDYRPAQANHSNFKAIKYLLDRNQSHHYFDLAVNKYRSAHIDDIRRDYSLSFANAFNRLNLSNKEQILSDIDYLIAGLETNLKLHKLSVRDRILLSKLYSLKFNLNNNLKDGQQAVKYLLEAHGLSPNRQQVVYLLAFSYLQINETEKAQELFKKLLSEQPYIAENWYKYLVFLKAVYGQEEANNFLNELKQQDVWLELKDKDRERIEKLFN